MHIAIVEDNKEMQVQLTEKLHIWKDLHKLSMDIDVYGNGADFLDRLKTDKYQMVFMDIYLEEENGIDVALEFRKIDMNCLLIFLTSSTEHMREAFPCRAFDYLLKPLDEEKLFHTLNEALRAFQAPDRVLSITKNNLQYSLHYNDIRYVVSQRNYCVIQADESIVYRSTFRDLTDTLTVDERFCQINRGILVNMDWVESFEQSSCLMNDGTRFPLHTKKQAQLVQLLIDYRFQKRNNQMRRIWND